MTGDQENRAVDLAHLDRYTGGDRALNAEVLRLFKGQADELVGRLDGVAQSGDAKAWREITHTLKGAARGIGAFAFADAAQAAEPLKPEGESAEVRRAVDLLAARARSVAQFIDSYLAA